MSWDELPSPQDETAKSACKGMHILPTSICL